MWVLGAHVHATHGLDASKGAGLSFLAIAEVVILQELHNGNKTITSKTPQETY